MLKKKKPTKTKTRDAQEVLSRTCDSEGVPARPATSAGPLHHARDRSALAESQPDQQPVRTRLTGCRHNSRNQLVHTTQQLPLHHACWVHRNLRGTRSPRCRATAESTRMTSGSRRSPHPHPLRHLLASCLSFRRRFTETKENDIIDETARLAPRLAGSQRPPGAPVEVVKHSYHTISHIYTQKHIFHRSIFSQKHKSNTSTK